MGRQIGSAWGGNSNVCRKCGQEKEPGDFVPDKRVSCGHRRVCKACINKQKRMVGHLVEEVCEICGAEHGHVRNGRGSRLAQDHDHKTGQLRGVLCTRCNVVLGQIEDSQELLEKCQKYLQKYTSIGENTS